MNQILVLIVFSIFLIQSCGNQQPISSESPISVPVSTGNFCQDLNNLLDKNNIDEFYQKVKPDNLSETRLCLEKKANEGKRYNFGVLLNANIITSNNEKIFKPDIRKVSEFVSVPNESRCFMNSALYDIANSAFFDDFLKIDKIFSDEWNKRNTNNLLIANNILRTLREVIYEIRLGEKTSGDRISFLRNRHIKTLENLNQLDIISNIYLELLTSYEFDTWEYYGSIEGKPKGLRHMKGNIPRSADLSLVKKAIQNYVLNQGISSGFGALGGLSCSLSGSGGQDVVYLDAIFSTLDPWGKVARFMSLALADKDVSDVGNYVYANDGYEGKLSFEEDKFKIYYFHSDLDLSGKKDIIKRLRDPFSKNIKGQIYAIRVSKKDPAFRLIAKSKRLSGKS